MASLTRRVFLASAAAASCSPQARIDCEAEFAVARDLARRGELAEAVSRTDACLAQLDDDVPALRAAFQLLRAQVLISQGKAAEATATLGEIATEALSPPETATYLMHRGYALSWVSDFEQAEQLLLRAEGLAARLQDPALLGEIAIRRGTVAARTGALGEGERLFRLSLEKASEGQDRFLEAMALGNLGRVSTEQGRYDEALDLYEKAILIDRETGSRNALAKDLGNRGLCYGRLGLYQRARSSYEEALRLHEAVDNPADSQRWLGNIGNLYYLEGSLREAKQRYEQALEDARALREPESVAKWLSNLAAVSLDLGSVDEAERFNDEALVLGAKFSDASSLVESRINAARARQARGRLGEAERGYLEAARLAGELPDKRSDALTRLGELLIADQRFAEAETHLQEAIDAVSGARGRLRLPQSKMSYLATLMRPYRVYVDLLMRLGRKQAAFEAADASRARTLAEILDRPAPDAGVSAAPLPVQSRIGGGHTVALSYWLAEKRSFLWAAGRGFLESFELPPRREIERLVRVYQDRIVERLRDPIATEDAAGRELFDILVGPAAHLIPAGSRVLLTPDGALSGLNFESLLTPGSPPRYWIEQATILVSPSLRSLGQTRSRAADPAKLLLIGDPDPAVSEFPKLPSAGVELNAILDRWGRNRTTVLRGAEASASGYRKSRPDSFELLHFTAHAEANSESPLDSAVILSPTKQGFKLYARDVLATPLQADLVTLSACRTAGSAIYAGEGLVGFAWTFLSAGAANVIAGLWNVADASTARLMEGLYGGLAAGRRPEDALRAAKLMLIEGGGNYRKPFYWAPFQLHTISPA